MIDIVYPLGSGSRWQNNELRYSLRSVEKYFKNVGNVFIIGQCPGWVRKVEHLAHSDTEHKQRNILNKINLAAAWITKLSERFLVMHDDHFILQEMDAENFPYYYGGDLFDIKKKPGNVYDKSIENTIHALRSKNLPTKYFDIHCPMIFEKEKASILDGYDWRNQRFGFVIKSLYANSLSIAGEPMNDLKIRESFIEEQLRAMLQNRKWFSVSDGALNDSMKKVLEELFPEKSKYEE